MKKKILCLLFITSIVFSLMPNKIFTSSSINKNELNNINLEDRYFDNICVSKENENMINSLETDKIIIILQINNPYMTVNGVKKEIDPGRGTVPVIIKGRTLVPIRAIIEEMGGTVDWDGTARKVTIKLGNTTIELIIDKKTAKVNGVKKELDTISDGTKLTVPPMHSQLIQK
ncbi:copper amine oxidase N-terminal domain-containing protein [bacterium]|nr:copper amine oxidase N-terminal domain-containing protein [bacterium]